MIKQHNESNSTCLIPKQTKTENLYLFPLLQFNIPSHACTTEKRNQDSQKLEKGESSEIAASSLSCVSFIPTLPQTYDIPEDMKSVMQIVLACRSVKIRREKALKLLRLLYPVKLFNIPFSLFCLFFCLFLFQSSLSFYVWHFSNT